MKKHVQRTERPGVLGGLGGFGGLFQMCIRDRANAERYITQELKELEARVLGARDRVVELEYQVFCDCLLYTSGGE